MFSVRFSQRKTFSARSSPASVKYDIASVLVCLVVQTRLERAHKFRDLIRVGDHFLRAAGNHQRDSRFVDENRVGLVHEREVEGPVDQIVLAHAQVVAQVVEPCFFGRYVGDVATVRGTGAPGPHALLNETNGQTQELVDGSHPLGIPAGQIIVERQDVDAVAGQGIEIGGQDCDQGLAFAGLHLDQLALVQSDPAEHLDIEGTHRDHAAGGLPHQGKRLDEQFVQRDPRPRREIRLVRHLLQAVVRSLLEFVLPRVDLGEKPPIGRQVEFDLTAPHAMKELPQSVGKHNPFQLALRPMQKRCWKPRRKTWPSLIAGEA